MKSVFILCAIVSSTVALDLPQKFLRRLETTGGHGTHQGGEFLALDHSMDRDLLRLKACNADLVTTEAIEGALEEVLLISEDAGVVELVGTTSDLVLLADEVEMPDLSIKGIPVLRGLAQFQKRTIDFAAIIAAIQSGIDSITTTIEEIVTLLTDLIAALAEFATLVSDIVEAVTVLISLVQTAIGLITAIVSETVAIAGEVVALIGQLFSDIVAFVQSIIDAILSVGATIFRGSKYTKVVECRYKSVFAALPSMLSTYSAIVAAASP